MSFVVSFRNLLLFSVGCWLALLMFARVWSCFTWTSSLHIPTSTVYEISIIGNSAVHLSFDFWCAVKTKTFQFVCFHFFSFVTYLLFPHIWLLLGYAAFVLFCNNNNMHFMEFSGTTWVNQNHHKLNTFPFLSSLLHSVFFLFQFLLCRVFKVNNIIGHCGRLALDSVKAKISIKVGNWNLSIFTT